MRDSPAAVERSLSVVIDSFNYEAFVGAAIESALAQTHPAQIIVVDDGSTDASPDIIRSFGGRVEAVFKRNGGQASAFNAGFSRATGDLVVFLDADDMLEPDAVATVLREWRVDTVVAQGPMTIIDAQGVACGVYPDPPSSLADGDVRELLLATGGFALTLTSGLVFSRDALLRVMPMPEADFTSCADGYLLRSVGLMGPVQRIDSRLACYRKHGQNVSDVCAAAGGLAEGFRKKIWHARNEFAATRDSAGKLGLSAAQDLGEADADYLGYRLFSLLLDPREHPVPGDRRGDLLCRYVAARWASSWLLHRRAFAISIAACAALGSPETAGRLIGWLHSSTSRPEWLRALAAIRRSLAGAVAPAR